MEVKQGFKQTEIGVIPEDWNVKSIGSLVSIYVGRDLRLQNFSSYQTDVYKYPVFSNTVSNEGLYGFYDISEYSGESLTIVGRGVGLGTAFKRSGEYGAIGRLLVLFPENNIDAKFLTEYINQKVNIFSESGGIPQLTGLSIAKYSIALPPTKAEQTAIATALSDTDALISGLEKLIEKKRAIKQGAMQQLLKPKEGWKVKKLGEILKIGHGKNQHEVIDEDGDYPILASGGIIGKANKYLYDKPSVLIGRKGTIDVPQFMETPFWTIDTLFYTIISEQYEPKFIFYIFNLIYWYSYNEASGVPSLSAKTIENIEIYVPKTKDEQIHISQTLTDMDAEITGLESKLEKYRKVKQGMMQELLTGKTRLI